jgi:hypothetical protein
LVPCLALLVTLMVRSGILQVSTMQCPEVCIDADTGAIHLGETAWRASAV